MNYEIVHLIRLKTNFRSQVEEYGEAEFWEWLDDRLDKIESKIDDLQELKRKCDDNAERQIGYLWSMRDRLNLVEKYMLEDSKKLLNPLQKMRFEDTTVLDSLNAQLNRWETMEAESASNYIQLLLDYVTVLIGLSKSTSRISKRYMMPLSRINRCIEHAVDSFCAQHDKANFWRAYYRLQGDIVEFQNFFADITKGKERLPFKKDGLRDLSTESSESEIEVKEETQTPLVGDMEESWV